MTAPARVLASACVAAFLLAGAACGPSGTATDGAELTIAAASSLRDLLEGALPGFRPAGRRVDVRVSYAASSTLSRQIENGAPYDVFVSADAFSLDRLGALVDAATRRVVLGNTLVLVGREDLDDPPAEPAALAARPLRVALAGPAVPAGRYARSWLQRAGLLEALESRVVLADSVRAALALVESGAADCGLVYLSDARAATSARLLWTAPPGNGPSIAYVGAALGTSTSPWADALLDWMTGDAFQGAAAAAGFAPPPEG